MSDQSEKAVKSLPSRIQLFIPQLSCGGAERQITCLANALQRALEQQCSNGAIELVTWSCPSTDRYELHPKIQRVGLGLETQKGGIVRGLVANRKRIQAIQQQHRLFQPEAVVSFCDNMNILVLQAIGKRASVLIAERNDPRQQVLSRPWEWMRTMAYPKAKVCVGQTVDVSNYLRETYFRRHPEKVLSIPSAINAPHLDVDNLSETRDRNRPLICLYMGRFSQEKGLKRLLEAWKLLSGTHPDWRLRLIGDGNQREELKTLSEQLGLATSVEWKSWTSQAWEEWKQANLYVIPSYYEGFPQSMLEAMTTGLPGVFTHFSPAIDEIFSQGQVGEYVPREASPAELAQALQKLLSDAQARASRGAEALRVASAYQWKAVESKWFDAIRRLG